MGRHHFKKMGTTLKARATNSHLLHQIKKICSVKIKITTEETRGPPAKAVAKLAGWPRPILPRRRTPRKSSTCQLHTDIAQMNHPLLVIELLLQFK